MEYFDNPQALLWILVGVVLILLEVIVMPGIGLITAGLGAITLAALIIFNLIDGSDFLANVACFFFFTIVWWVIIWRPIKRSMRRSKDNADSYDNIIGTYGIVDDVNGLVQGKIGHVKWSGARMRARIRPESSATEIKNGETIWIYDNKEGILLVDNVEK